MAVHFVQKRSSRAIGSCCAMLLMCALTFETRLPSKSGDHVSVPAGRAQSLTNSSIPPLSTCHVYTSVSPLPLSPLPHTTPALIACRSHGCRGYLLQQPLRASHVRSRCSGCITAVCSRSVGQAVCCPFTSGALGHQGECGS